MPEMPAVAEETYICPNCGTLACGVACHGCGQKRIHEGDLSLKYAFHHTAAELFHLDSRFFTTLRLLCLKPGQLTLDFLEGRRKRHMHPIQLYLLLTALYFVLGLNMNLPMLMRLAQKQNPGLAQKLNRQAEKAGLSVSAYLEQRNAVFQSSYKISYQVIPLVTTGPLLFLFFRRRWKYLAQHLLMAIHYASFGCALGLSLGFIRFILPDVFSIIILQIVFVVNPIYLILSCRRVYQEGILITIGKCLSVYFISFVFFILSILLPLVYVLRR